MAVYEVNAWLWLCVYVCVYGCGCHHMAHGLKIRGEGPGESSIFNLQIPGLTIFQLEINLFNLVVRMELTMCECVCVLLLGPALFLPGYLFNSLRTAHAQLTMGLFRQRA